VIFLKNKNVFYIDYLESYLDVLSSKYPKWFRKFVYKILNKIGFIKQKENSLILYCDYNIVNLKMIQNLLKRLNQGNVKNIVLADKLLENKKFVSYLDKKYYILKGIWLYKFLILDFIEKIAFIQNRKMSDIEITILCNKSSDIILENIKLLAKKCKILNILTNNINEFSNIENSLYENEGQILNVSSNFKKVCLYSDIVVNIDFNLEELKKCVFKKGNILIQTTMQKFENRFGITIVNYKLKYSKRYVSFFNCMKHFDKECLYESLIYYNTSFFDIRKFLKRDEIAIVSLFGLHGKLNFREFRNVMRT